jgi:type II secretory pathway pseudopilin PulG
MCKFLNKFSSGDTIIEVLIAVTIFSIVAVGGISVMNQGAATAQRSLEITLVRQEIDAQAEAIRFLNAGYLNEFVDGKALQNYSNQSQSWIALSEIAKSTVAISNFGISSGQKCSTIIPKNTGFVINTHTLSMKLLKDVGNPVHSETYAKINYDQTNSDEISSVDGLWIEAVMGQENAGSKTGYVDFHIRACWDSIGQSVPMTIGTIVRLYEPR